MRFIHQARSEDNKDCRGPNSSSRSGASGQQAPIPHQRNSLTTPIAMDGVRATHLVKVQVRPLDRRAANLLTHDSEDEKTGDNRAEADWSRRQYSPHISPMSFLIIDAHTMGVPGSPEDHPNFMAAASTSASSQSGFNSLNGANPTVEAIAIAQQYDGSFPVDGGFICLLTGSPVPPSLPVELTALAGSEQDKHTIWATMLALAVFAKNLQGDAVSWRMLAEKAGEFVRTRLVLLGVDAGDVTAVVNRLRGAAAKYVSYKFWFPILKNPDGSVVILVVSIDG
jgi:hypothetical protein